MFETAKAARILKQPGNVAVIPTDTVYGLAARAFDPDSVNRLYSLKQRDHKPGTLIAKDIDQLRSLGLLRRYLKSVEQFWPGPVSVLIPVQDSVKLNYLTLGRDSLAVRIPAQPSLIELLSLVGPLMTSSANAPGEPTATTIEQARAYFKQKVDAYFDGGDLSGRKPSTIIRVIDDAVEVVREGAVKIAGA
jgi:tRNA threonylcarbamoyl adenosine modification protein (Sua5/YciO/YrdC/YwlC family)